MSCNYFYSVEEIATKMYELPENCNELNVLCYHINNKIVEPFLLFMVKKDETTNTMDFFKILNDANKNNIYEIEKNVDALMKHAGFINYLYHGIICDNFENYFVVIEIKNFESCNKNIILKNNIYFSLTTEIINYKKIFEFQINEKITEIFTNTPMLGILTTNDKNKKIYKLPDIAYKYTNKCQQNYYSIFGNEKEKIFENCDEYYFFNREYLTNLNNLDTICCIKYAIFTDNQIYFENEEHFSLTDDEINEILLDNKYKTLFINYLNGNPEQNYDLLAVNYNSFISLL